MVRKRVAKAKADRRLALAKTSVQAVSDPGCKPPAYREPPHTSVQAVSDPDCKTNPDHNCKCSPKAEPTPHGIHGGGYSDLSLRPMFQDVTWLVASAHMMVNGAKTQLAKATDEEAQTTSREGLTKAEARLAEVSHAQQKAELALNRAIEMQEAEALEEAQRGVDWATQQHLLAVKVADSAEETLKAVREESANAGSEEQASNAQEALEAAGKAVLLANQKVEEEKEKKEAAVKGYHLVVFQQAQAKYERLIGKASQASSKMKSLQEEVVALKKSSGTSQAKP